MGKKRYSLEELSELKIDKEEITVEDRETGEEKTIKTVSRAEVATIVAYALERPYFSAVFSCSGAFLAFLGIIFATCSKPKKRKRHLVTDEIVAENDDINKISENSIDNEE